MIIDVPLDDLIGPEIAAALSEAAVLTVLGNIGQAARAKWIQLAQKNLHGSSATYVNSIQALQIQGPKAILTLVGQPANLIEHGMDELDMRTTLLGPNVPVAPPGQKGKRQAKDGSYYRAIPFRHSTPGSAGTVGAPMGSAYENVVSDSKALGRKVYAQAKKLKGSTSDAGGTTRYGGSLPSGLAPKLKSHHSTDIYAGMIRLEKTYEKATQSSYMTFRMISTNPNTTGWIRPATEGVKFSDEVTTFIKQIAPMAFEAYVAGLGK